MKKFFYIIFLFLIVSAAFYSVYVNRQKYQDLFNSLNPCDRPITFRIDTVDKQFNLSHDKFIADAETAAAIWNKQSFSANKAEGKNLFVYDPNGKLSINLIFDQRQAEANQINQLDKQLANQKSSLDSQIQDYKNQVADLKKRLADYNAKVQSWNSQGGAPPDVYDQLNKEGADLQAEANRLNDLAKKLNLSSENYNVGVGQLNNVISDFNADLEKKPEEGIFMGDQERIEIYFNNNQPELIHTLAHELGHALGLAHVNSQKSIMYPYTTQTVSLTNDDLAEVNEACRSRSIFEVLRQRLNFQ